MTTGTVSPPLTPAASRIRRLTTMKWQSPPILKTELRKGAPLMVPRTGTRPRAPKVFSTSKGRRMEQTSPPSLRLTTARKRLTGDFACEDFGAAPLVLEAGVDAAPFVLDAPSLVA